MNLPEKLYLAAALLLGLLAATAYSQDANSESIPKITVHFAESHFIQEVYDYISPTYTTEHVVSHVQPALRFDGYLYRVKFAIILDGENSLWNKPLQVLFTFENGNTQTAIINEEMHPLYPNIFYDFSLYLKAYVKGWVRIDLIPTSRISEEGFRFYGTSFSLR
ncbi:MAG: hypothetical protein ACM3QX_09795 [Syntrophomonadaceae bacterium]